MYLSSFFLVLLLLPPSLLTDVQIRLVGPGSTLCSGRVEVYHNNSWGTVCDDDWDLSDAQVVCRQMDCGAAVKATDYALFGQGSGKIWLDDMHCSGYEDSLTQCQGADIGSHNCGHSEDAGVVCSASLPKPYVTVTPSEVNCSITTEFTEGKFILKNSNQDLQTSADNPATFNLPQVTFYNEGPYYCLYQIKVSGQFINSPQSDPIMLHVTVPLLFVASTAAAGGLLLFLLMLLLVCLLHKRRRPRSEWTPRAQVSDPAPNQQEGDIYAVPQSGYSDDYEVLNVSKNHVKPNKACLTEENGEEDDPCNDDDEDNAYENVQQTSLFVECGPK